MRLRDVAIVWTVLATIFTPILYPIEYVNGVFRTAIMLNPLTPIFNQAHESVIDPSAPARSRPRTGIGGCW